MPKYLHLLIVDVESELRWPEPADAMAHISCKVPDGALTLTAEDFNKHFTYPATAQALNYLKPALLREALTGAADSLVKES